MAYTRWLQRLFLCVFLWSTVDKIYIIALSQAPIDFARLTKEQVVNEAIRLNQELITTQCQCQCQSQCQCSGGQSQCQDQCQNQCQSQSNSTKPKTDCYDWLHIGGAKTSGIYQITPPGIAPFNVYCDMETDGGGWIVMQRRVDGTLSFYDKTWNEYKNGFDNGLDKNLWLGNEKIHALSTMDSNVELRIDMWGDRAPGSSHSNIYLWQKQSSFYIDSEANYYTLHLNSTLVGNASTSGHLYHGINYNIGKPFSTIDNIHDGCNGCCRDQLWGGWWSFQCGFSSLNGKYIPPFWQQLGYCFDWYITNNNNNAPQYIKPSQSRMMLRKVVQPLSQNPMTDCYDWLHIGGAKTSGIYQITPGIAPFNVYCDMETDGGGWTVFQRRIDDSLSFYDKTWNQYKVGFSNGFDKNFWLGNDIIHVLSTKDTNVELRVDIWGDRTPNSITPPNGYWFEKLSNFSIDNEANFYTLHISNSNTGNISYFHNMYSVNNIPFSTVDSIHGSIHPRCFSEFQKGAWWMPYYCTNEALNGKYIQYTPSDFGSSAGFAVYTDIHGWISPKQSRMMLRNSDTPSYSRKL